MEQKETCSDCLYAKVCIDKQLGFTWCELFKKAQPLEIRSAQTKEIEVPQAQIENTPAELIRRG